MAHEIKEDMTPSLNLPPVMLASASPRRRELMRGVFGDILLAPPADVDETVPPDIAPLLSAEYAATKKLHAYRDLCPSDTVLVCADTVVVCDDCVLGKPHDAADAARMLRMLSDNTHTVATGVAMTYRSCDIVFSDFTTVRFAALSDSETDFYISAYRPFDKAGAYGIQEWIGYIGIKGIKGDFYNVMGLPVRRVYETVRDMYAAIEP